MSGTGEKRDSRLPNRSTLSSSNTASSPCMFIAFLVLSAFIKCQSFLVQIWLFPPLTNILLQTKISLVNLGVFCQQLECKGSCWFMNWNQTVFPRIIEDRPIRVELITYPANSSRGESCAGSFIFHHVRQTLPINNNKIPT